MPDLNAIEASLTASWPYGRHKVRLAVLPGPTVSTTVLRTWEGDRYYASSENYVRLGVTERAITSLKGELVHDKHVVLDVRPTTLPIVHDVTYLKPNLQCDRGFLIHGRIVQAKDEKGALRKAAKLVTQRLTKPKDK